MKERTRWLQVIPLIPAAILMGMLVWIWGSRLLYPYDLEWMEGGMLTHAWRILHGLPMYPAPGPDWIPFIYPPGYASLLAAGGAVFGLDYPLGRMISLGGAVAAAGAAAFLVSRHGGSRWYGLLSGVVFLGCYPESGGFYDLCRIDGLFVGLLAWSLALAFEDERFTPEASGLLLAAAFLVKQNGALFGVPLLGMILARSGWRPGFRFLLCAAGPALAVTGYLEWVTDTRYLTYILGVAVAHPNVAARVFPGTPWELGSALPFALAGGVGWFTLRAVRADRLGWGALVFAIAAFGGLLFMPRLHPGLPIGLPVVRGIEGVSSAAGWVAMTALMCGFGATVVGVVIGRLDGHPRSWKFWGGVGVAGAALVTAALMRGHHGGFLNVHMQLHWVVAVSLGLAASAWLDAGFLGSVAGAALMSAQLGWQVYRLNPGKLIPDAADHEAGDRIVAQIRDVPGPVLSPFAPWLPVKAGHPPGFHLIALWDVTQHARTPFPAVGDTVRASIRAGHWGTALDDGPKGGKAGQLGHPGSSFGYGVRDAYEVVDPLPGGPKDAVPMTGWRARPRWVLAPKGGRGTACPAFEPPVAVATVDAAEIIEASGLVASRARGVFWTHNDSGDLARIFALGTDGRRLATVVLRGVDAIDVEDIASGAGPNGRRALFVADIGDNAENRSSVTVWRLEEPAIEDAEVAASPLELRYPDRPHDAEALLVDPRTDYLYILTKSKEGTSTIFRGLTDAPGPQVLTRVGELRFGAGALAGSERVTAGDVSADGSAVVVRTYTHAFWFRREESVEAALMGRPCAVPVADEQQGEAIGFGDDGQSIWTISEGDAPVLYRTARRPGG